MDPVIGEWRERVRVAQAERRPLRLRGAGTKDFYGESLRGDVLDLTAFSGLIAYEPSELVLSVRCGTRLSEIEHILGVGRQHLAFEPPRFGGDPTIGGTVASGLSGPRRPHAGAARDFVLGATLLDAQGELLQFGGRVMKNVAGFDISRLLCGSLGILGAVTEVTLKVSPAPEAEETRQLSMTARRAVAEFNRWLALGLPISGTAWLDGSAWVRISGAAASVRAATRSIGGEAMTPSAAGDWWAALRDQRHSFFDHYPLWRVSVPTSTEPLDALRGDVLIEWAGAVRWHATAVDGAMVRREASRAGGTAIRWRGPRTEAMFPLLTPSVARVHRELKQRFDPAGIFNPGRLVAGL